MGTKNFREKTRKRIIKFFGLIMRFFVGGSGWVRTTVVTDNRFTVYKRMLIEWLKIAILCDLLTLLYTPKYAKIHPKMGTKMGTKLYISDLV